jgi:hypothetical protein
MLYIQRVVFFDNLCFQIGQIDVGSFGGWKKRYSTKGACSVLREPVIDAINVEGMTTWRYPLKPLFRLVVC